MYHEINETAARRAREANSYRGYVPGSATAEYRAEIDEAAGIAEGQKSIVDPIHHERIDRLFALYCRKLAEHMNKGFEIEARVPSILVAGGSNFPVQKKEKQNAARSKHRAEYEEIKGILDKIRGAGTAGISSDDPDAIEKLKDKLMRLVAEQTHMKAANAHWRKHKTMKGFPEMSDESAARIDEEMKSAYTWVQKNGPFESFKLTNNNANIKRVRDRIAQLEKKAERAAEAGAAGDGAFDGWEFDGGCIVRNYTENRLQILFNDKPDQELRTELKRYGFRWAPSQGAWQRLLSNNAEYDAKHVLKGLIIENAEDKTRAAPVAPGSDSE